MEILHTAHGVEILMVLLLVTSVVGLATKWVRLPYSIVLVIVGLLIGSSQLFPRIEMTPDLILLACLPALIFEASWNIRWTDLKKSLIPIVVLASVGVVISMFVTGWFMHDLAALPWNVALLFGALTAATDPISVLALFRKLGLDKRLNLILEAESLFNDGTAVVLFKMVLLMTIAGTVTPPLTCFIEFLRVIIVGALVGFSAGYIASRITRFFDDHLLEITLTTIVAYGSYLVADEFDSSAVIAVVVAGIVLGNYGSRTGMSASTRLAVNSFWEYAAFAVNSIVFLLIGLQINLGLFKQHAFELGIAIGAILFARIVVVYCLCPFLSTKRQSIPWNWRHLLFWGALRGSLSMALALSIPTNFPMREKLIVLTFGVVLFTLIVSGLTIDPLVRAMGMLTGDKRLKDFQRLRSELYAEGEALESLETLLRSGTIAKSVYTKLRDEMLLKQQALNEKLEDLHLAHSFIEEIQLTEARKHIFESKKISYQQILRDERGDPSVIDPLLLEIDSELDRIIRAEEEYEHEVIVDHALDFESEPAPGPGPGPGPKDSPKLEMAGSIEEENKALIDNLGREGLGQEQSLCSPKPGTQQQEENFRPPEESGESAAKA